MQYLQALTTPIPRALWPSKPIGSPVQLVNLNEFGDCVGLTLSLAGDVWVSGGWLGVFATIAVVGLISRTIMMVAALSHGASSYLNVG